MMHRSRDDFQPAQLQLSKPATEIPIRSVPELVDFNAVTNPDALFCFQAVKASASLVAETKHEGGFDGMPVTMSQLREAILRCKDFLTANGVLVVPPRKTEDGKLLKSLPVALFMDSDLGLLVHLVALMGLGVPVCVSTTVIA
jgi:hypothetical protein